VCYDKDEDIYPAQNYNTGTQKINADVFESRICGVYIDHILEAIRQVFEKNQRPIENRSPATPADVDAIFLAGAGSRLYFISKILTGEAKRNDQELDPGFEQIKSNHSLLFNDWEDPSQCCALGALVEQEKVVCPNYARNNYYVQVRLFEHDFGLTQMFQKSPDLLSAVKEQYEGENGTIYNCRCICDQNYPLASKYAMLPVRIGKREKISYMDHCYSNMAVQMIFYRVNDDGNAEQVGLPYFKSQPRKLGDQLWSILKGIASVVPLIVTGATGSLVDGVLKKFGHETHIVDTVSETFDNIISPKSEVDLDFGFSCSLLENNTLQLEAKISSKYFTMDSDKFIMDV